MFFLLKIGFKKPFFISCPSMYNTYGPENTALKYMTLHASVCEACLVNTAQAQERPNNRAGSSTGSREVRPLQMDQPGWLREALDI